MTKLSVNINKVALIRNARGRNYPDVNQFAERCLELGAHGITLHPRPDQRHARYSDVAALKPLCQAHKAELNVEGYPCEEFMQVVLEQQPDQCTLVPDDPNQVTSDHGWRVAEQRAFLEKIIQQLKAKQIRVSLFVDGDTNELELIKALGADRIELYTEPYAEAFEQQAPELEKVLATFAKTAQQAQQLGLGVNAGHDLNLENLGRFLTIPNILEVSIGHALTVESLEMGLPAVIAGYQKILATAA